MARTFEGMLFRVKLARPVPADRNRPDVIHVDTIFGRQELTGEQGEGNEPTDRSVVSEEEM